MRNKSKLNYKYSKYSRQILICLLCSVLFIMIFVFGIKDSTIDCAEIYNTKQTKNQAVAYYDKFIEGDETFRLCNGDIRLLNKKGQAIITDVYMTYDNVEYVDNLFHIKSPLKKGECIISYNLLISNNLRLNDLIYDNKGNDYKIINTIKPQPGLDKRFNYEGICIIGQNNNLDSLSNKTYIRFVDADNMIADAINIKYLQNYRKEASDDLIVKFGIMIMSILITILLGEILSRNLRKNYTIKRNYGVRGSILAKQILNDMAAKYIMPYLIVNIVYLFFGISYGYIYIMLSLSILIFILLNISIYICIYLLNRNRKCKLRDDKVHFKKKNNLKSFDSVGSSDYRKYLGFATENKNKILKVQNVEVRVKDNFINYGSFEIFEDDFVLLQGKNGSGKSTFFKLFNLYQHKYIKLERKENSDMTFYGRNEEHKVLDSNMNKMSKDIAIIDQDERFLNKTIYKILHEKVNNALPLEKKKKMKKDIDSLIESYYKKYISKWSGMNNYVYKHKNIKNYSGGQQKLIYVLANLIKAEINQCKLILMDEPLNNLDLENKRLLNCIIREIRMGKNGHSDSYHPAFIVISHCMVFDGVNVILKLDNCNDNTQNKTLIPYRKDDFMEYHKDCLNQNIREV